MAAARSSLKDLKGKKVVLYFYPKDDTSGCTAEACAFRDNLPDFSKVKAAIVGVSRNSVASHDKFKTKYKLPFPLVSDEDGKVCEAYGTWVEKSMYGRKYMGIERATFLIDGEGRDPRHLAQGESPWPRRRGAEGRGGAEIALRPRPAPRRDLSLLRCRMLSPRSRTRSKFLM